MIEIHHLTLDMRPRSSYKPGNALIDKFAVKWDSQRREQQPRVPVGRRRCADCDIASRDQLRRIGIIVDLDLGKVGDNLGREAEADVATTVAAAAADTLPVLDAGHDDVDAL